MNVLNLAEEVPEKVDELDLDWDIYGVIDQRNNVYSLTYDAKIIGRIFELLSAPAIRAVADEHNMEIVPAESQTIYPDFTLTHQTEGGLEKGDRILSLDGDDIDSREDIEPIIEDALPDSTLQCTVERDGAPTTITVLPTEFNKVAIDVKTTYREFYSRKYTYPNGDSYEAGDIQPFTFTLGSYASFLRNPTKNIQYDYRAYAGHYIMGFVYTRNDSSEEGLVKDYTDRGEVPPPYKDVEYFVSEKYEIAGEKPGSGNTENIGSFRTNDIEDLREGNGPFAEHGEDLFEEYWRNHGRYREEDKFSSLEEFFEWREENNGGDSGSTGQ